jgi:hypothetical protein
MVFRSFIGVGAREFGAGSRVPVRLSAEARFRKVRRDLFVPAPVVIKAVAIGELIASRLRDFIVGRVGRIGRGQLACAFAGRLGFRLCRALLFRLLRLLFGFFLGLSLDQSLTVGKRDLIIVGMDFRKARKPWRFPPYSTKAACRDGSTRVTFAR